MKTVILFLFLVGSTPFLNAQCIADAGGDIHRCSPETTVQLGGGPSASGGMPPYTYEWSIEPIAFDSNVIPFLYASTVLSDTTTANPILLYNGVSDSLAFFLTITDSLGCQSTDTIILTTTHFGIHLTWYDYYINQGDSVYLNQTPNIGAGYGTTYYDWNPSYGLSDTTLYSGFWASPDSTTAYTATVTDSKGCTATAGGPTYIVNVTPVGLDEYNKVSVNLYPNPTRDVAFIQKDSYTPISKMEIYSPLGVKLATELKPRDRIDLAPYPKGTYVLKLYFEEGISIKKLVKN